MKRSAVRNSWLGLTISTSRIEGHYTCILELPVELVPGVPAGIGQVSEIVEDRDRVSELTDELSGILHLGTSTTIAGYWLPYLLEGFKRRYPRVVPRVSVGNSQLIESRVMDRNLDVGLIEIITEQPTLGRRSAGRDELQLIVAPDHPLATAKSVRAEQLVADQDDEDLNVAAELGSLSTVKHMAAQGFGIAIASAAAIRSAVTAGRLVGVPLSPRLHTPLEVILLKDKFRSRLVNTFADFVTEEIGRMCATEKV